MKKILLSVAGYDPTSGAGVLLDLRVFEQLDFQGVALLTSVTAQNTQSVEKTHHLPPDFLWNQYVTLREDVSFSGIKVGMVGSKENIPVVARILSDSPDIPKVIDPVFKSSSGHWLIDREAIPLYLSEIKGKASVLTPNLEEAGMISEMPVINPEDMEEAARIIYKLTRMPCLIKGGHLLSQKVDLLFDGESAHLYKEEKLDKKVHGCGCFLSSSLLAYLTRGHPLEEAFVLGARLTHKAIKASLQVGRGQNLIEFPVKKET